MNMTLRLLIILFSFSSAGVLFADSEKMSTHLDKKELDALEVEAHLSDKLGDKEEANLSYDKMLSRYSLVLNNPSSSKEDKIVAVKKIAQIYTRDDKFYDIIQICRNFLLEYPNEIPILETEAETHNLYATYHLSKGDLDSSIEEYRNILDINNLVPEWYAFSKDYIAHLYLCKGDFNEALFWYNRIIEDHPNLKQWPASAHYSIAKLYLSQDDKIKAKEALQIIITKYPTSDWSRPAQDKLRSLK